MQFQEQVWFERQRILQRSPRAFQPKVKHLTAPSFETSNDASLQHTGRILHSDAHSAEAAL